MYHIAICDDDKTFIQYIERLFKKSECNDEVRFYEYLSGEELVEDIPKQEKCDLLILDMKLEKMDGHETAKNFRLHFPNTLLVYCSGVTLPTVESFEAMPYRFWLKEYTEDRMQKELDVVVHKMQENKVPPFIMGKKEKVLVKLRLENVQYIEITKKGSIIHWIQDGKEELYTSPMKVSTFYETLKDFGFVYAHNSYIVNMNHVAAVHSTELELLSGEKLAVSRSKTKEFRKAFACKLAEKY